MVYFNFVFLFLFIYMGESSRQARPAQMHVEISDVCETFSHVNIWVSVDNCPASLTCKSHEARDVCLFCDLHLTRKRCICAI